MFQVNHERLERLLGRLLAAYRSKEYPYNLPEVISPQHFVPESIKNDREKYAYFLFVLCYWMRGRIRSDVAAKSLVRVYEADSDLFNPYYAKDFDPEQLRGLVAHFGLGSGAKDATRFWVSNSELIVSRYDGNLLDIFADFEGSPDEQKWDVAVSRIKNQGDRGARGGFAGFREKMVSMIIYYLMAEGFIPRYNFPIPVDGHVSRMVAIHGVVEVEPGRPYTGAELDELLEIIRMTLFEYSKGGFTALELSDVLWLFSRSMCSRNPIFWAKSGRPNGRSTVITPYEPVWTESEIRAHDRTCGSCPVSSTCTYVHHWKHWSYHGSLRVQEKPALPRQMNLFSPDEGHELMNGK